MTRDPLGTLAEWQRTFGDVVHLQIWPEHTVVVTDPQLVRELLVTHHDSLVRWELGTGVLGRLHGHNVLIAEGDAWRRKRHALQPVFTPKALLALVPKIAAATTQAFEKWLAWDSNWPVESALISLTMDVIVRLTFSDESGEDAHVAERAPRTISETANAAFYRPVS
ncbi:cytochrome P450 [Paraburkholderia acidicola]|uniref:cytochrome P450 n=1 Tax=Paraburkholderia acidicola TaxID=1912599 RepID=UPI0032DF6907